MANYVKNEELLAELRKSHERDEMTNRLAILIQNMIDHLSWNLPYKDPELKQDVKAHAMYVCVENWRDFDMERESAFSWFTTTILNGLRAGFKKYTPGKKGDVHIQISKLIKEQNSD